MSKLKDYIQLHLNILLFSLTSVFSKAASVQYNKHKQNIVVEYGRDFRNALDSASAAAVFSFEILRQKKVKAN